MVQLTMYDVFISYAGEDKETAYAILNYLESNGIICWIATRDALPGEAYAASIIQAIENASIFLLVFSKNSNASRHVLSEIDKAFNCEKTIIPFKIDNSIPTGTREYYLRATHWLIAMSDSLDTHLKELFSLTKRYLERTEQGRMETDAQRKIPQINRPHNPYFTGRDREIKKIRSALEQGVITAIKGMAGIGKSTIAYEYAHEYINSYHGGIYNFNAADCTKFTRAMESIGEKAGMGFTEEEQKNLDLKCRRIWQQISHGQDALLILDNVDKEDILKNISDYAPDRHKLHILITSRKGFLPSKNIKEIPVTQLEQSSALDLLLKLCPAANEDEKRAAEAITQRLGGHPLALTMVGTFLSSREDITYPIQLQWFEDEGIISTLSEMSTEIDIGDNPVPEEVFGQMFTLLNDAEMRVMEYAALLPPDSVPLPWIFELVKDEFPEISSSPKRPISPWNTLLQKLKRLQLLIPSVDEPQIGSIHRLTQEAVRKKHDRNKQHTEKLVNHANSRAVFLDNNLYQEQLPPECLWKTKLQPLGMMLRGLEKSLFAMLACKIAFFEMVLGDMLMHTGSLTGAGKHFTESLEISRQLTQEDPNNSEWQYILVRNLDRIGNFLRASNDLKGAKNCFDEALAVTRQMVKKYPDNGMWLNELCIDLDRTGDLLEKSGDLDGMKNCYEESLEITRQLVQKDPDNDKWQRSLSVSLYKTGHFLEASGDLSGAMKYFTESLEISRRLVERDPNNLKWQRDVSVTLTKIGDLLKESGDLQGAKKCHEESLEGSRRLAASAPNNAKCHRDITICLGRIGDILKESGELQSAKTYYEESLELTRQLTQKYPGNSDWQRDLPIFLARIGDILIESGDLQGAKAYYEESLELTRQLVKKNPDNRQLQRDLSIDLGHLGNILKESGDLENAKGYCEESLEIIRLLAQSNPDNSQWQRDLIMELGSIGNILKESGDLQSAKTYYEESLELTRQLAKKNPNNTEWRRYLAIYLVQIGDILKVNGDFPNAKIYYEQSLELTRHLKQINPDNSEWQRDLFIALGRIGDLLKESGDLQNAKGYYEESLELTRQLVKKNPNNTGWQRDLAIAVARIGDLLKETGDLQSAKGYYEESLELARQLAKKNPINTEWQKDLTIALGRIGDLLKEIGDLQGAKDYYEESLDYTRQLAQKNQNNTELQRNLAIELTQIGEFLKEKGDLQEAKAHYEESLAITRQLLAKDDENIRLKQNFVWILNKFGDFLASTDNGEEAMEYYREALGVAVRSQEILERQLTCAHPDLAACYSMLGTCEFKLGNVSEAIDRTRAAFQLFANCEQYTNANYELDWLMENDPNVNEFLTELGIDIPEEEPDPA